MKQRFPEVLRVVSTPAKVLPERAVFPPTPAGLAAAVAYAATQWGVLLRVCTRQRESWSMRPFILSAMLLAASPWSNAAQVPTPASLWQQIQALQASHALMIGSRAEQPGSREVDVYTTDLANAAANDAIAAAAGVLKVKRYPNGALVVKENENAAKKLTGITAMLKLSGYDKADRDWVMAAYKPDGRVVSYGKVQACIACHVMVTAQDLVFAPPPEQLLPVSVWKAFFPKQALSAQYVKLLEQHPEAIVK